MEKTKKVGPRVAFTPDGKILFFDHNGIELDPKRIPPKQFLATIGEKELQAYESISFFSLKGSECKIVIVYDKVQICYIVDCESGQIIGQC